MATSLLAIFPKFLQNHRDYLNGIKRRIRFVSEAATSDPCLRFLFLLGLFFVKIWPW